MKEVSILLFAAVLALASQSTRAQSFGCPDKDYKCQLKVVMKAMEADPKNPENYYNVGLVLQRSGGYKEAVEAYSMYVSIPGVKQENLADGYNNRGMSHRKLGRADLALADFGKAFELAPANPAFVANRGNARTDLKKYDDALADYVRALQLNPRFAPAYSGRGHIYMAMSKPDDAIRDFTKALEYDPGDAESYYNRGVVYSSRREYAKAIADYDKYIRAVQGSVGYEADGYINRGIAHAALGNREKALQDFTKVIEIAPRRANGYRARAMIYREMKKDALAEADEKKASELSKPP